MHNGTEVDPRELTLKTLRRRIHQLASDSGNTFDGLTDKLRVLLGRKPVILDLFCGEGGCAQGYADAGFEVIGVDRKMQKRYPFAFHQLDWAAGLEKFGSQVDAIHASPPCQKYSSTRHLPNVKTDEHQDLVAPVRAALLATGKPYILENVLGAPLGFAVMLCGLSFNLKVFRHRFFESSIMLFCPPHLAHGERRIGTDGFCCVAGNGGGTTAKSHGRRCPANHRDKAAWSKAMGIDWMTRDGLAQAIPPAYTKYLGSQLANYLLQQDPPPKRSKRRVPQKA